MKKSVTLIALSALAVLVGCQRELVNDTPEETGVKEVTTQFVLNVATAPQTKMSATAVQKNNNFRGIKDTKIFTYKTGITSGNPYVLDVNAVEEKRFDLDVFFAASGLDNPDGINQSGDNVDDTRASKRVLQLSLPINVDAVMLYGRAITPNGADGHQYGATNDDATTISGTPKNTIIAAKKIMDTEEKVSQYDQTAALMIFTINNILQRYVEEDTTPGSVGSYHYNSLPYLSWAMLGHQYEIDHTVSPNIPRYANTQANIDNHVITGEKLEGLEEVLGKCYYLFTYLRPSTNPYDPNTEYENWKNYVLAHPEVSPQGEYRAGSSFAIKSMVVDMYKVISAASTADPTTDKEANARRLAKVILDRAKVFIDENSGNFNDVSDIKLYLSSNSILTTTEVASYFGKVTDEMISDYPGYFDVPEGAAQLGFHVQGSGTYTKDEFYYYHPNRPLVNPTMVEFEPRKYLYPAELWYYVNSPIRTTDKDVEVKDYPDGVTPWNTEASWTNWTFPGKVGSATRGVAVANSINYGVAMLKTAITWKEGEWTKLKDNRKKYTNNLEDDREIGKSEAQLSLKGVLIGGVNPRMNWQFTRYYTTAQTPSADNDLSLFDGVIYDNEITEPTIPTVTGGENYTLVYDNYNSSGAGAADDQNDVYVALELVNGGQAFWGRDNLIPSQATFYLVGKLPKPTTGQISDLATNNRWPSDHQIPPLNSDGTSKKIARVFIQDFMTSVTFKLGQDALKKAYYSMPDLRAANMSLGLSVDVQWIPGLEYTVDL